MSAISRLVYDSHASTPTEAVLKLIIEDDEGRKTVVPFVRDEITIGRQEGNTIRLTERNVSRRHARLVRVNGHVLVEDLGSYNGIRVNGERIQGKSEVQDGDLIQIGDYDLAIQHEAALSASQIDTAVSPPPPPLPAAAITATDIPAATDTEVEPVSGDHLAEVSAELIVPTSADEAESFPPARRVPTSLIRAQNVDPNEPVSIENINPEDAPRLMVLNTELAGREFACIRSELTLGRAEDNDIAVDHRSLSRTHAKLRRDGEGVWRVFDLQSANGLTVNGDVYSQAILRHGDEIELGHVRFKFIGAGQTFRFVPEPSNLVGRVKRVRWPLVVSGAVLFFLVAFTAYREGTSPGFLSGVWALVSGEPAQATAPVASTRGTPPAAGKTVAAVTPAPAALTAPVDPPEVRAAMDRASDAIAALNMDRAVTVLTTLLNKKDLPAARREEATELLARARAEIEARRSLTLAKQHLASGRLDEAQRLLDASNGTHAYAQELAELRTDLAAAQGTRKQRAAAHAVATSRAAASAGAGKDVDRLFKDGTDHFVRKQYKEAATSYTRCLEVNPEFARCHMMLGSTYARLGQAERGAEHYRRFVKLAPNDGEAAKVRILLEEYEKTKRRPGSADGSQ